MSVRGGGLVLNDCELGEFSDGAVQVFGRRSEIVLLLPAVLKDLEQERGVRWVLREIA